MDAVVKLSEVNGCRLMKLVINLRGIKILLIGRDKLIIIK